MRIILTNCREIEAAIRTPRARTYCVIGDYSTHQIDQVRRRKNRPLQLHLSRGSWTSDILTVYKEV